ncbi:MAG: YgfZ/GcvT domain-containing protein [Fimbriimonadales bacterium]
MSKTVADPLTPEILESFDRLRADSALFEPGDVGIIEIRGEDRKGWLQGQSTNDLKQLDMGASSSFCLCSPTGQLLSICDIWGLHDRFLLTCSRSTVGAFLRRVEQMVVLEDVEAQDVTGNYTMLSVQGPNATRVLQVMVVLPTLDAADSRSGDRPVVALRSNRTGLGGWDILVPRSDKATAGRIRKAFPVVLPEALEIARIEAGIPAAARDWDAKTLPPELGPAFEARHISYKKGCYTGQEVLMRIHSRGHTNRTWVALLSERPLAAGNLVGHPRRKDAGIVTSACYSPDYGYIAGAMLRNEAVLEGEFVTVETSAGPVEAEIRHMPVLRFG